MKESWYRNRTLDVAPSQDSPAWTRRSCWRTACSASPGSAWGASRSRRTSGRFPRRSTAAGNRVLITRVPSIAGVEHRAARLGEQILKAFPDEPVHVIGHSMGGLDARRLLANPAWQRRILSLSTIGTPHLGTALADFAKLRVGRIFRLLSSHGNRSPRLPGRHPQRRSAIQSQASAPRDLPCFSVAGIPDARNGLLAPHPHLCRTLGARRTQRWIGPGRLGTGLRHSPAPLARRSPSPDELDGARRSARPALAPPLDLYAHLVAHLASLGFGSDSNAEEHLAAARAIQQE